MRARVAWQSESFQHLTIVARQCVLHPAIQPTMQAKTAYGLETFHLSQTRLTVRGVLGLHSGLERSCGIAPL